MATVQEEKPALSAVVRDVRTLAMMLRAIAFTPLCRITVSKHGIQVITEVNCVLQATAYLSSGLFADYEYNSFDESGMNGTTRTDIDEEDDVSEADIATTVFEVSLSDLLVCLNIYGNTSTTAGKTREGEEDLAVTRGHRDFGRTEEMGDGGGGGGVGTEMRLRYDGVGHPLILELHEGSTTTCCELSTFDANTASITEMPFSSETVIGQAIMASKDLTEAFQSIDSSTREVMISFLNGNNSSSSKSKAASQYIGEGNMSGLDTAARLARASSSIVLSTSQDDAADEGQDHEEDTLFNGRNNGAPEGRRNKSPTTQMMRIRAEGDTGSIELDFPNHFHVFEKFLSIRESSTTFPFNNLQRCLKALQTSLKTSLRIDETGTMSLQCLFPRKAEVAAATAQVDANNRPIRIDPENQGFVELRMLPLFTDQDDE